MLVLEMSVLAVLAVTILVKGGPEGYSWTSFAPSTFFHGAPGIAIMFAVASFIGFEATAIYSEEARDPKRTIPAATYIAVLVIGVFYAVSSWTVVIAYGPTRVEAAAGADTAGLVFSAGSQYLGTVYADIMNILLLTSLFASLLAFHNAVARYLYALGRQGVAPAALARTHRKHGSPRPHPPFSARPRRENPGHNRTPPHQRTRRPAPAPRRFCQRIHNRQSTGNVGIHPTGRDHGTAPRREWEQCSGEPSFADLRS